MVLPSGASSSVKRSQLRYLRRVPKERVASSRVPALPPALRILLLLPAPTCPQYTHFSGALE